MATRHFGRPLGFLFDGESAFLRAESPGACAPPARNQAIPPLPLQLLHKMGKRAFKLHAVA